MQAKIIEMLKNTDLSGDPTSGTVEGKRFVNVVGQAYGTARSAGKGNKVKAKPVIVAIDDNTVNQRIQTLLGIASECLTNLRRNIFFLHHQCTNRIINIMVNICNFIRKTHILTFQCMRKKLRLVI